MSPTTGPLDGVGQPASPLQTLTALVSRIVVALNGPDALVLVDVLLTQPVTGPGREVGPEDVADVVRRVARPAPARQEVTEYAPTVGPLRP